MKQNGSLVQNRTMQFLVQAEVDMYQTQTRTGINQYTKRGIWLCNVFLIYP